MKIVVHEKHNYDMGQPFSIPQLVVPNVSTVALSSWLSDGICSVTASAVNCEGSFIFEGRYIFQMNFACKGYVR